MSTNHTANYNLCQWEATDQVQRTDFNEDNAKIDAALNILSGQVAQKAEATDLTELGVAVAQKAEQTALSALSATVAAHTAQIATLGNCAVYASSYSGTGYYGSDNKSSLTFPARPILVWVVKSSTREFMVLYRSITKAQNEEYTVVNTVSWGTNSVSWYCSDHRAQMNEANTTYRVYALLDCDET